MRVRDERAADRWFAYACSAQRACTRELNFNFHSAAVGYYKDKDPGVLRSSTFWTCVPRENSICIVRNVKGILGMRECLGACNRSVQSIDGYGRGYASVTRRYQWTHPRVLSRDRHVVPLSLSKRTAIKLLARSFNFYALSENIFRECKWKNAGSRSLSLCLSLSPSTRAIRMYIDDWDIYRMYISTFCP